MIKFCTKCKIDKDLELDFHKNLVKKDKVQSWCKLCINNRAKIRSKSSIKRNGAKAHLNKEIKLVEYLSSHPCIDCGIDNLLVLQFDHIENNKRQDVSLLLSGGFSWKAMEEEIAKCEVVCANCHTIRTQIRNKSWRLKYVAGYRSDNGRCC